jgi:hypothetical protein
MENSIGFAFGLIRVNPVIVTRPAESQVSEDCKIGGFAQQCA